MTKNEFIDITSQCFAEQNCVQNKKQFAYEHENMYLVFILIKSNYSDCYYIDYNCSLKTLHPKFDFSDTYYDIILQPRLTLSNGITQLKYEEMDALKYEEILRKTIKKIFGDN